MLSRASSNVISVDQACAKFSRLWRCVKSRAVSSHTIQQMKESKVSRVGDEMNNTFNKCIMHKLGLVDIERGVTPVTPCLQTDRVHEQRASLDCIALSGPSGMSWNDWPVSHLCDRVASCTAACWFQLLMISGMPSGHLNHRASHISVYTADTFVPTTW